MLQAEGLSEELLRRTLHNLQAVFDDWTVPQRSHTNHRGFTRSTTDPFAVSRDAGVWRGEFNAGGADDRLTDACLKAIKIEKVHEITSLRP